MDKAGPAINSRIAVRSTALAEADRLDDAYRSIPVILKAPIDARGMATTLGSFLYKCWGRTIHGQPTKTSGISLVSPDHLVTNQGAYGESKSVIDLRTLTEFQQSFASYVSENRAQSAKPSAPL
ncbi:MAG: hypothetical protein ACXWXZ_20320 [Candidatus Binatia bacterium]